MRKDDRFRLQHMLDAAKEAIQFADGKPRTDLDNDRKLVLAIVRDVEIIGEAASKVSPETRAAFPKIPGLDIINMRHHLVHVYFDVDLDVVWDTIKKDLPTLASLLDDALKTE